MLQDKQKLGLIAGFVVLAGVAVAGWMRTMPANNGVNANGLISSPTTGYPAAAPGTFVSNSNSPAALYPPYRATEKESGYSNNYAGSYEKDGYYSSTHRPIYVRQNVPQQQLVTEREPVETVYEGRRNTRVYQGEVRRGELRHGRSTGKSVAIVAGSAGAGAAIGAIAGGGKGAAIGAVSGGGAGFIYDRLTHNH